MLFWFTYDPCLLLHGFGVDFWSLGRNLLTARPCRELVVRRPVLQLPIRPGRIWKLLKNLKNLKSDEKLQFCTS